MSIGSKLFQLKESAYNALEEGRKIYRAYSDRQLMKSRTNGHVLTPAQRRAAKAFWAQYVKHPNVLSHEYYTEKNGLFFPDYIPLDLYYTKIDTYFNDWNIARVIDHKCYFDMYLPDMKQPTCVAKRINRFWFDPNRNRISKEQAEKLVMETPELFVKIAKDSSGGKGVWYLKDDEDKAEFWSAQGNAKEDLILQLPVKQHPQLNALYPHAINTIRVISMLREEDVKIYSVVIRMGQGGMVVDNLSSGGMSCGITEDNRLKRYAYTQPGERCEHHPDTGTVFLDYPLPSIDRVREIVKTHHQAFPHFRLMSWDFAIDEHGDPVLIEVNLSYGDLDCHQFNNGPLFGEDTKEILDEVFGKK